MNFRIMDKCGNYIFYFKMRHFDSKNGYARTTTDS